MERYNYTDSSNIAAAIKEQYFKNYVKSNEFEKFVFENNERRSGKQLDLESAASGYGHELYCPEGIPVETALFALLGAAALSFGILFMEITMITGAKRKKRDTRTSYDNSVEPENDYFIRLTDIAWKGMFQKHDFFGGMTRNA